MMDQAEILRQLASKSSGLNEKSKIITITSGKGGVGKSNFVVNLAIALAKERSCLCPVEKFIPASVTSPFNPPHSATNSLAQDTSNAC